MSSTTVFIAGLTGKFARMLAGHLLAKPNVRINGTARSPSKLPPELSSNPRVSVFQADAYDVTTIRKALKGSSVAICCYLGDTKLMSEGQKTLIDASIAEGVPRYIAGDWSLDFRGLKYGEHPLKDPMKQITEYLEEKKDRIQGVHILNGAFMEIIWSVSGLYDGQSITFRYWGTGDEKLDLTTYDDAANYTAEVALDPSANGFIEVRGDAVSAKEIAAIYHEVYDVEPKVQRLGSLDDLHTRLMETRKAQPDNVYAWMGYNYNLVMLNGTTSLRNTVNSRFPNIHPTTVRHLLQKTKREDIPKLVMGL